MQKSRRYVSYTAIQIRRLYIICGIVAVMALGVIVFMEWDDRKFRKEMKPDINVEEITRNSALFIDLNNRYESTASELDALTTKWNHINAEYLTLQAELSEMNKQLAELQTSKTSLQEKLADQAPVLDNAATKLNALVDENETLKASMKTAQEEAAHNKEMLEAATEEMSALRNDLITSSTDYDKALQQVTEWQRKYVASQQKLDELLTTQQTVDHTATDDNEDENSLSVQSRVRLLESKMLLIRYDISMASKLLDETSVLLQRIPIPSTASREELRDIQTLKEDINKTVDRLNKHLPTP